MMVESSIVQSPASTNNNMSSSSSSNGEVFNKKNHQQPHNDNNNNNNTEEAKSKAELLQLAERNLVQAIEKSLKQAQKPNVSVIKQQEILSTLFHDISQPIDVKFKKLLDPTPISSSSSYHQTKKHLDGESSTLTTIDPGIIEDERVNHEPCNYFYELISRYYYNNPARANQVHSLAFHNLITNHHFPSIYALLFHRWLFASNSPAKPAETTHNETSNHDETLSSNHNGNLTLSRCNIFLKGTNRLFWSDVENYTFRYKSLFTFMKVSILLRKDLNSIFQFMEPLPNAIMSQHSAHTIIADGVADIHNDDAGNEGNNTGQDKITDEVKTSEEMEREQEKELNETEQEMKMEEEQISTTLNGSESKTNFSVTSSNPVLDKNTIAETSNVENATIEAKKQEFVIESKKRDLISLVAKYFFYYEDRNSRQQLPSYIFELSAKYDAEHQFFATRQDMDDNEDEYDELSQLDEVGGWASLFSSSSTSLPNAIDYRRFSITDPSFNELFDNPNHFQELYNSKLKRTQQMISDMFVTENIFLLSVLNNERILVSIMNNFRLFKQLDISSKCKVKLQAALYAAARPGPPNYPPRAVRHKAQAILDELFPKGRYIRFLMNSSFRVLHHFTWPLSIVYWCKDKFVDLLHIPFNLIQTAKHHFIFDPKLSTSMNDHIASSSMEGEVENDDDEDHYYLNKYDSL